MTKITDMPAAVLKQWDPRVPDAYGWIYHNPDRNFPTDRMLVTLEKPGGLRYVDILNWRPATGQYEHGCWTRGGNLVRGELVVAWQPLVPSAKGYWDGTGAFLAPSAKV
jgi:hypothetical protein